VTGTVPGQARDLAGIREQGLLEWAAELIASGQPSVTVPSAGWAEGRVNWLAIYAAHVAGGPQPEITPKVKPWAETVPTGELL
jgi:hypothetical protein